MKALTNKEIKTLFIVLLIALSSMLGVDINLASLPYIAKAMHSSKEYTQQSTPIFLLGMGLSLFIYGPLSDKYGRKPIVIIGLLIATIASFSSILSLNINFFLCTRFFQGIGLGVGFGIGRTIFADILKGEMLATIGSYLSSVTSISPLLAPVLGGYLQHWFGFRSSFVFMGFFYLVLVIMYSIFCHETNIYKNKNLSFTLIVENYVSLLKHKIFIGATILTGIGMAVIMIYATTSSFIFQGEFHLTPIKYGYVTMVAGLGAFCGKLAGPTVIRQFNSVKVIRFGLILVLLSGMLITLILNSVYNNITLILIAIFIAYFGNGFIMPSVSAQALGRFNDKRGVAGALFGAFQVLVAALGSGIIGMLPYKGIHLIAYSYVILAILGLFVYQKVFARIKIPVNCYFVDN